MSNRHQRNYSKAWRRQERLLSRSIQVPGHEIHIEANDFGHRLIVVLQRMTDGHRWAVYVYCDRLWRHMEKPVERAIAKILAASKISAGAP